MKIASEVSRSIMRGVPHRAQRCPSSGSYLGMLRVDLVLGFLSYKSFLVFVFEAL